MNQWCARRRRCAKVRILAYLSIWHQRLHGFMPRLFLPFGMDDEGWSQYFAGFEIQTLLLIPGTIAFDDATLECLMVMFGWSMLSQPPIPTDG